MVNDSERMYQVSLPLTDKNVSFFCGMVVNGIAHGSIFDHNANCISTT